MSPGLARAVGNHPKPCHCRFHHAPLSGRSALRAFRWPFQHRSDAAPFTPSDEQKARLANATDPETSSGQTHSASSRGSPQAAPSAAVTATAACGSASADEAAVAARAAAAEDVAERAFPPVPWDGHKVLQVMLIWLTAFFIVGAHTSALVPSLLGTDPANLSTAGHALGYLFCECANLALIHIIVTRAVHPYSFWRGDLFSVRFDREVVAVAAAALLFFPAIDAISALSQALLPAPPDALSARLEQSLTIGDGVANALYLAVVSLCTPLWEEAIFRGFLLSSLTRYMPPRAAIFVAAAAFAAAHFSVPRGAYLLVLGLLLGAAFVWTRNLMAPVLIHALWNGYVFFKVAVWPFVTPALAAAAAALARGSGGG